VKGLLKLVLPAGAVEFGFQVHISSLVRLIGIAEACPPTRHIFSDGSVSGLRRTSRSAPASQCFLSRRALPSSAGSASTPLPPAPPTSLHRRPQISLTRSPYLLLAFSLHSCCPQRPLLNWFFSLFGVLHPMSLATNRSVCMGFSFLPTSPLWFAKLNFRPLFNLLRPPTPGGFLSDLPLFSTSGDWVCVMGGVLFADGHVYLRFLVILENVVRPPRFICCIVQAPVRLCGSRSLLHGTLPLNLPWSSSLHWRPYEGFDFSRACHAAMLSGMSPFFFSGRLGPASLEHPGFSHFSSSLGFPPNYLFLLSPGIIFPFFCVKSMWFSFCSSACNLRLSAKIPLLLFVVRFPPVFLGPFSESTHTFPQPSISRRKQCSLGYPSFKLLSSILPPFRRKGQFLVLHYSRSL